MRFAWILSHTALTALSPRSQGLSRDPRPLVVRVERLGFRRLE